MPVVRRCYRTLGVRAFSGLLLLLTALSARAASAEGPEKAPAAKTPRLTIVEASHRFGTVPQGEPLRHQFKISNSGDDVLRIIDVVTTCGCTTTGDWPRTLQPGQSGAIPVELNTAHIAGPLTKTISILSNDPLHPEAVLELSATVWTPVSIANPVLLFPAVADPRQSATRSTTLRNQGEAALKLSDPHSENPLFLPLLEEVVPGKEYKLTVTTLPPLPDGTQTGRITIKSSIERVPEIAVQAVATVLPAVQIAPKEFGFTTERLTTAEKRFAVVLNHRGLDLQVTDLATNAPGVQLDSAYSNDRKQFTITVTFPAGFEVARGIGYVLRGKTNQPRVPEFEIPIVHVGSR